MIAWLMAETSAECTVVRSARARVTSRRVRSSSKPTALTWGRAPSKGRIVDGVASQSGSGLLRVPQGADQFLLRRRDGQRRQVVAVEGGEQVMQHVCGRKPVHDCVVDGQHDRGRGARSGAQQRYPGHRRAGAVEGAGQLLGDKITPGFACLGVDSGDRDRRHARWAVKPEPRPRVILDVDVQQRMPTLHRQ
jgi:hypothetical protein